MKEESRDERQDAQKRFEEAARKAKAEMEDNRRERKAGRIERIEIAWATLAENKRKDKVAERRRRDEIAAARKQRDHEAKMLHLQVDLAKAGGNASAVCVFYVTLYAGL